MTDEPKRPSLQDVLELFRDAEELSTIEIIARLQERGFDIDKRYFWDHIAPELEATIDRREERLH